MAEIKIQTDRCKGCLLCVAVCPQKTLGVDHKLNSKGIRAVRMKDEATCSGCSLCAIICPDCCIEVYK